MGRKSQPWEICGSGTHRRTHQAQPRPADCQLIFRLREKFFQLLGAAGEGGEARPSFEYGSEISRDATTVLDSVSVGRRGDDGAALAGCGAASVAGGALFYTRDQCLVLPGAMRAAASRARRGLRRCAVAGSER